MFPPEGVGVAIGEKGRGMLRSVPSWQVFAIRLAETVADGKGKRREPWAPRASAPPEAVAFPVLECP